MREVVVHLALPPLQIPPERVRDLTREVLSRRAYDDLRRNAFERWLDELRLRVAEFLADLLGGASGSVLAWIVAGFGVVVLLLLAFVVLRRLRWEPTAPEDGPAPRGRDAADWAREASDHEAAGRWREAVRAQFRVLTATLVARGLVEDVPGTTVGEYRTAIRGSAPELAEDFDAAADEFERIWYAHGEAGPGSVARLRAAAAAFELAGVA